MEPIGILVEEIDLMVEPDYAPVEQELVELREEAINGRKRAGYDRIWKLAREQYQGIDETNRKRELEAATTLDGPLTTLGKVTEEQRSTVFVNITKPYTNAATSRVCDIYLPTGKLPCQLRLSPVSDLEILRSAMTQFPGLDQSLVLFPELQQRLTVAPEAAEAAMDVAWALIKDWFKESHWTSELRLLIEEAGQTGTGVLKGPVSRPKKLATELEQFLALLPPEQRQVLELRLKYVPVSECIKVENLYPDPACGRSIHNGEYVWEQIPDVSKRKLQALQNEPGYFPEQIELCIQEGAKDRNKRPTSKGQAYSLWLFHGMVPARLPLEDEDYADVPKQFGTATLCNDRLVKLGRLPLDSETFPYDVFQWRPRENSWTGIGVPEDVETAQRGLNASVRAMQDNLGYSVGPQVVELKGVIDPADGDRKLRPWKHWIATINGLNTTVDDIKKAFTLIEFPNYSGELLPVITWWLKMAEDTTSLPLLLQGQSSTDAVGVSQQLQNNATTNLRLIVKALDSLVVEPHVGRYYEWTQLYGPPEAKGDAVAEALGSSVLIVKELQQQALLQLLDRFVQPIYGKSPKKGMDAILEGSQLDPEKFDLDEEEQAKLEAAANAPDPRVEVMQIEAEAMLAVANVRAEVDRLKIAVDAQEKKLSLAQAEDTIATQTATQLTLEQMRQDGKAQEAQSKPKVAKPPVASKAPEPELSTDDALQVLGLV